MSGTSIQMFPYEIRNFKVYFGNEHVPDARWSDFIDLGQGYGKDSNHVFYMGQVIEHAHAFSFHVTDNAYAKDHQYVFQHGRMVASLQPDSVASSSSYNNEVMQMQPSNSIHTTPTSSYEIRDFKVFFNSQHVPDARWIDFTDLGQGYGKDTHHVFFMGHPISKAHSFSFEVLDKGYAKDKNYVFQYGRIIEGLNPLSFQCF